MSIFKRIGLFIRKLQGTLPCENLAALCRYIPIGNVDRLAYWIEQNIWYTRDVGPADEWKNPERTIREGKGDCEDLALVGKAVIDTWPLWRAEILCLYDDSRGHAVCCYERPDGCKGIIEGRARTYEKDMTWEEIADDIFPWATIKAWKHL